MRNVWLEKKYEKLQMHNKEVFEGNEKKREEWIKTILKSIEPGSKILDAGAGECQYKKYCSHLNYTSQDFCEYDGKGNGEGGQVGVWNTTKIDIVCDIVNMPIEDNFYDVVMCTEVLEHLVNPERAICEMVRVMKPGGLLILTAPFVSYTHFAPFHYCTGFNKYWYRDILKKYHCVIEKEDINGNYFEFVSAEMLRITAMYKEYLNVDLDIKTKIKLMELAIKLKIDSKIKNKSDEFLCFGYQILARKEGCNC